VTHADLLVAGVTALAALVSGLAGFAFALVASGFLMQVHRPVDATALVLALSFVSQMISIARLGIQTQWRKLAPFVAGGLVGLPIGLYLVTRTPVGPLRLGLGVFLIGYPLAVVALGHPRPLRWGPVWADALAGFTGGVLGSLAGFSGALTTIWISLKDWTIAEQRGVYAPYFVAMQLAGIPLLLPYVDRAVLVRDLTISTPGVIVGTLIGAALFKRASVAQFRIVVLILLFASGAALIIRELTN
jgi:hypothetical protein